MQIDELRLFYEQENMREAVKEQMLLELNNDALKSVYGKEDTDGYPEAKKLIQGFFSRLRERYEKDEKKLTTNHAK